MKALVNAFNQEKTLVVGVFSLIIKTDGPFTAPIREGKRLSKYQERQEKKDKIIMKTERKQQEKEIQLVEMETILLQIGDENIREGRRLSKQHEEQKTKDQRLDAREKKVSRKEMKKEQDPHNSKCIFRKFH